MPCSTFFWVVGSESVVSIIVADAVIFDADPPAPLRRPEHRAPGFFPAQPAFFDPGARFRLRSSQIF